MPGGQHDDAGAARRAGDRAPRREADEVVEQLARVRVDGADAELGEPVGQRAGHDLAVREHVRDAARRAQVVLQHEPAAVVAPDQVAAGDVDVLVVGDVDPDHLAPEVACEHDEPARHHAVPQDLLGVVDVVDERVERPDPLSQAALDDSPLVRGQDAGDRVEREDPLGALLSFRVDREGDAAVEERAVRELRRSPQVASLHRRDLGDHLFVVRAGRHAAVGIALERLVVEAARVVPVPEHARRRCARNHRPRQRAASSSGAPVRLILRLNLDDRSGRYT